MSNILDHTTFDQTDSALEIWNNMDKVNQAEHILAHSREYEVYKQALINKANIIANAKTISNFSTIADFRNSVPGDVGNV